MAQYVQRIWKWLLVGAAVIAGAALAYFAGNERNKADTKSAVDATRSDDAVRNAEAQAAAAQKKALELAAKAADEDARIEHQRADLASGKVSTDEIDELLRQRGIIR